MRRIAGRAALVLVVHLMAGCGDVALPAGWNNSTEGSGGRPVLRSHSQGRDDRNQR